jgi:hypothetical protein
MSRIHPVVRLALVLLLASRASAVDYSLADLGPVGTPAEVEATLTAAVARVIAEGGGFLHVDGRVAADWVARNPASSSTKRGAPTVTVVDRRFGIEKVYVPGNGQADGAAWTPRQVIRSVTEPIDMTFGVHSTETIDTRIAGGTASYDQPIVDAVKAGTDVRIYLPSQRGLAVGTHFVVSGVPRGYGEPVDRGPIKAMGWDKARGLPYVVMDLKHDHPAEALFYNKHVVNSLTLVDHSQSDNQSMGLNVARYNYGQGDSFVIAAHSRTMGNVMSGAGDEGGLTYASDIYNDLRPFRSKVVSMNPATGELVFEPGPARIHTLGTSRPLINFNTSKWVTAGNVHIVAPGYPDPWLPVTNKTDLHHNGAIIGSKDCGWTREVIGRFFAIDEPGEYLDPANDPDAGYTAAPDIRVHRWYQIMNVEDRPDGTKRLYIERTRWWARHDAAPTLYDRENMTWKGHERPLKYIIAPGAQVADISRGWKETLASGGYAEKTYPRTLVLAPSPDTGTAFDFQPGDPIAQAIGSDPWNVTGMRIRHFNYVPSTIEDSSVQAMNIGRVAVHSAFSIAGEPSLEKALADQKDRNPYFLYGLNILTATRVGLRFAGDTQDAAIHFVQRHGKPQPMMWNVKGFPTHRLTVDPERGGFALAGGATSVDALNVSATGGISAGALPARNLRGIGVAVRENRTEHAVQFPQPEADAAYALHVQPSWFTAVTTEKTPSGFTARFEQPAPADAKFDWILVR